MKAAHVLVSLLKLTAALQSLPRRQRTLVHLNEAAVEASTTTEEKPCFWKHPSKFWQPRTKFEDLEIGQKLTGVVFQELLKGKTGAKMFMDCGVGRIDKNGEWQIVTGMHRIRDRKKSVITKKATRLRKKIGGVDLWVSRIYAAQKQFEVVVNEDHLPDPSAEPKIPASSLKVKQELTGTVVRVKSYGVIVDVGANRNGLLHIQRVADLVGHYVDKEEGLAKEGLEKGAKIRVAVASNDQKRLFLDFTDDVKAEAEPDEEKEEEPTQSSDGGMSEEELAAWAEFAAAPSADAGPVASASDSQIADDEAGAWAAYDADDSDDEDGDEGFDEDRDIEDALGIGMY